MSILIAEPLCDTLSIGSSGKSSDPNETMYDNVYGNYEFQLWDKEGFAYYRGKINRKLRKIATAIL